MARKLKTFVTSLGFFDLAIAAPSKKAALEAWGAGSNLFHQGVAKEVDDPDVVDATMAKPGVVLRRRRDPAGASLNTPIYPPISTARGETGRAARRRSERCRTSVKKLHGKRPWTSKRNRSVEKPNVGARKLPGRWSANGATRAVAK